MMDTAKLLLGNKGSVFDLKGSLTELFGEQDGGKTSYVLQLVKRLSEDNHNIITHYVDADNKITYSFLKAMGVDTSRIGFSFNANNVLQDLEKYEQYADILVIDSITMFNNGSIKAIMPTLRDFAHRTGIYVLATNQLRYSMAAGRLMPYYDNVMQKFCDIRIDVDTQSFRKEPSKQNILNAAGNIAIEHLPIDERHSILRDLETAREAALNLPRRR